MAEHGGKGAMCGMHGSWAHVTLNKPRAGALVASASFSVTHTTHESMCFEWKAHALSMPPHLEGVASQVFACVSLPMQAYKEVSGFAMLHI